jgi:hypothetical protein
LIVGTNSGYVYVYAINNHVFDPIPGKNYQNTDKKKITSIDVCNKTYIAVGGNSQDVVLYFLSNNNKNINF